MKIRSITIRNFRSYYGETIFEIGDGLTMLIGDNGDGKTTFFEALEWVFDTTDKLGMDKRYISQKRMSELLDGTSDMVSVTVEFEHYGEKTLTKSFRFSRDFNGNIKTSDFKFIVLVKNGAENYEIPGKRFDDFFDPFLRNYSLFKGESQLDIFNNKDSLNFLVEKFSDVTNFDPYVSFSELARDTAERAKDNATSKDKQIAKQSASLQSDIRICEDRISQISRELRQKQKEATNFAAMLENIEKAKESSTLLKAINDRLSTLKTKRTTIASRIKEDYTIRLLDERWVLMGFADIAREYSDKISRARRNKSRLEKEYQQSLGANKKIQEIQTQLADGKVPLPLYIPTESVMREMLNDHVCKVCGTPAPEGSEAYKFMQQRLNDYLESLKKQDETEEEDTLFKYHFINELEKRDTLINNDMNFLSSLPETILEDIRFNQKQKDLLAEMDSSIAEAEEEKRKILAQAEGLDEVALINAYESITNWWDLRSKAEKRIVVLESQLKAEQARRDELFEKYDKLAKDSSAATYARTAAALRYIANAFNNAKARNKREFIDNLERLSNEYLEKLNEGDFTGVIRIMDYPDGTVKSELYDSNQVRIYNPNTALKTTMYMAILFAISQLTTIKRENNYPLIFDAPTSSFSDAKEGDFFRVLSTINKQTIIASKSFLIANEDGVNELDETRLDSVKGTKYRISKKRPFDDKDLSTIEIVSKQL